MDYKQLWEGVLTRLSPVIGKAHLLSFFKDSIISRFENGVVTIAAPSTIACNFIRDRYEVKLFQMVREMDPDVKQIDFEIQGGLADAEHPSKVDMSKFGGMQARERKVPNKQEVLLEDGMRSKMFNPRYTLQNFIAGTENRLAHAACMAVAAKPGDIYNPLFLYGGVGLGKTHLLQGTGIEIKKNYPNKNVVYMTSERFINEIVEAIGKKHTSSFKDRYRKVDCLIVDDIQFFGNKASSQQEFFHTFNELYDAGKQIIISSDRPPRELDELEDRLVSRFAMGMVVELQLPEFETRMAILNAKCQEYQVFVDREVLEFMAYNVQTSIRELEGILVKAIAEAQLTDTTPTIKSVAEAIRRLNKDEELKGFNVDLSKRMTVRTSDDVIDLVVAYFKLTRSDITGEERRKQVMVPRQICMYLIRELLDHSYETIGESFGGRNHTTVLHACNKIGIEMDKDSRIKRDVNALKREIGV
ncbi:MAG TPA: chromosomal replication initiator protein DnaA [Candidatus Gracilibacteria bacterium]|nr:chromosomal replication initiator protein DnaA [Candidatus Gracilibacteria bacterium]